MILIIFILGLVFGSFYNVCIYRLPIGKSIVFPRSSCGACGHELSGLDMIPVLSYLFSKGKCRYCEAHYSPRYAVVEFLTAVMFVITYMNFGYTWTCLVGLILSSIVIIVTFIDIDHHIILDRFSIIIITAAVLYHYFISEQSFQSIVLGFLIGGGFLFVLAILSTMGGGDIKILASYGLLLGFPNIILTIYLSFVAGALFFMPVLLFYKIKKRKYDLPVPFGPFLSFATWITFLFGERMIDFYLTWML